MRPSDSRDGLRALREFLELGWTEITEVRVTPLPIVKHLDVIENDLAGFLGLPWFRGHSI